jgi:hypothetical protein
MVVLLAPVGFHTVAIIAAGLFLLAAAATLALPC